MLPAHLAENIKQQVMFYLQSTFDFSDPLVESAFQRFLEHPENGLFKGPWVQLSRPYRTADQGEKIPFDFDVPFHPFKHQSRSWRRLNSNERKPQPTIVTTGTGSGKTECFLFPILDHCLRAKTDGQKGIKAIILYPMNALASDQEKRFAKLIYKTDKLKKAGITVGNYTGRYDPANPGADTGSKAMGKEHGISSHATQQSNPPDILLTNYKMLDYLLMRPQDQQLWRHNKQGVLQYLVLDELHTYDGAQGSDVACLIRRLKERLEIPKGDLCVVGTSATLDDRDSMLDSNSGGASADAQESGSDRLARFARTLFEEEIRADAVIEEDRLSVAEIVSVEQLEVEIPDAVGCFPSDDEDSVNYAIRQSELWGGPSFVTPGSDIAKPPASLLSKEAYALTEEELVIIKRIEDWSVELGTWIKKVSVFDYLLQIFASNELSDTPLTWDKLVAEVSVKEPHFNSVPDFKNRSMICASFFALVAQAKERRSGTPFPLVPTQIQIWIRELRRLGRRVDPEPRFVWLDEPEKGVNDLPAFHCSECGESGWIAMADPNEKSRVEAALGGEGDKLVSEPSAIYRGWFGFKGIRSPQIRVISPRKPDEPSMPSKDADGQMLMDMVDWYLCTKSLVLRTGDGPCPLTDDPDRIPVKLNRVVSDHKKHGAVGNQGCPNCLSTESVMFIGSQGATLSSVAIDELFGSVLNSDPKLLAFTDSVQDASHRAGFFTSRTYRFTLRTALQHVIDGSEGAIPLIEAGKRLLDHWSLPQAGWAGGAKQALASLMPPDLQQYDDYLDFRNDGSQAHPRKRLSDAIEERLTWETVSEFGLMQTHGRTMEASASACVGWNEEILGTTIQRLKEKLPGIDSQLEQVSDKKLRVWLYGVLHRTRVRGGLSHPYLGAYASQGFWGKYPFGKAISGRETHPPLGRFRPKLMVTKSQKDHDYVLAPSRGGRTTWHLTWARKAIGFPNIDESSLLDLIHELLRSGTETGLFRKFHQDGDKEFYAIASSAAVLTSDLVSLKCNETGKTMVRPRAEAAIWLNSPSIDYRSSKGVYETIGFNARQEYYRDRYRKGAVRRVVANEHTGLLATEAREDLEKDFADHKLADDPNVLTCTSTLEMGIDIGDLSSTMLCSIPPTTASYLQRIGRAGRSTGTALIVSVVNQRPHDLFFYGRPSEMLRGKVDPPGCWLDASAVLVRQYLAYCFDTATAEGVLAEFPKSGKELVKDLSNQDGNILRTMSWITKHEGRLQGSFLKRFGPGEALADTRNRFTNETESELLIQRIHVATNDFARLVREIQNARSRIKKQLDKLSDDEQEARVELEREQKILKGRLQSLSRTTALEILTDNGLLPNYAFPERGVRFYGSVYNKHSKNKANQLEPIEASRPAASAIKELAPSNHFYTHRRRFEIQQIAIGNNEHPLVDTWAICGACGHMRLVDEINRADATVGCPQCGHDLDKNSQLDLGQQRKFVEFAQSQAISYMEHYDSLAGDRSDERNREFYQTVMSFDLTKEDAVGAVGDEERPFGIEYRASVILREVNVGFGGQNGEIAFGVNTEVPEEGFQVCKSCGIVAPPDKSIGEINHRRSCKNRRASEKRKQEGKKGDKYEAESVYLYRQLNSEAIRLLLPVSDENDVDTLTACIHLGLRLRFEGNPAHLIITPQAMPDHGTGMSRFYLVLMDGVPGGTGFLKSLYQQKSDSGLDGQGIIDVLRLAKNALETCACRQMTSAIDQSDTDGCYRCIRTYRLQYDADRVSRERGIDLLGDLIEAGEKRQIQTNLDAIKPNQVFGSMLERRFVDRLRKFVESKFGTFESTIIRGKSGFRFSLGGSEHHWELELQPELGMAQGVMVKCQPDFLLSRDDSIVKPIAIFTDGFEYHCHPNNRLADDFQKRRSILNSDNYLVWNITWDDLHSQTHDECLVVMAPLLATLNQFAKTQKSNGFKLPSAKGAVNNGFEQLLALLESPDPTGWVMLATFSLFYPLQMLVGSRTVEKGALESSLTSWASGDDFDQLTADASGGDWVYNNLSTCNQDFLSYIRTSDALSNRQKKLICIGRLDDSEQQVSQRSVFTLRWRRFLAAVNLFQFCPEFTFWTSKEFDDGIAPDAPWGSVSVSTVAQWQEVLDEVVSVAKPMVRELSNSDLPLPGSLPLVGYEDLTLKEESFAELAWPNNEPKIAVLAGEQASFSSQWLAAGWTVYSFEALPPEATSEIVGLLKSGTKGE